jgi:hypothetical protein
VLITRTCFSAEVPFSGSLRHKGLQAPVHQCGSTVSSIKIFKMLLTHSLTYLLHGAESSASQEIPHILWNLKFHYCLDRCPPPGSILSQINPLHPPISLPGNPSYSHYYSPIYAWVFQVVSFPQIPSQKHIFSPPYMLHAPPISFFSS